MKYHAPAAKEYEKTANGLKFYSLAYRKTGHLHSVASFSLDSSREVRLKWMASGLGGFMGAHPGLWDPTGTKPAQVYDVGYLSTGNAYGGSVLISENVWHFTRTTYNAGKYKTITATGNYDDKGGVKIQTKTGTYATGKKYNLSFRQGDPHNGPGPYIVLGEASINAAAKLVSIAVTPANPSIVKGVKQQFKAIGTYSDNSTKALTDTAIWSSTKINVATVSSAAGSKGLATSVAAGSTTVAAAVGTVSGSTTLTVTDPLSMDTTNWKYFSDSDMKYHAPAAKEYEKTANGLKFYSLAYRKTGHLHSVASFSLDSSREVRLKWMASGLGGFMGAHPGLWDPTGTKPAQVYDVGYLSTGNAYGGSVLISENVWHFTRTTYNAGTYKTITATGNYDDKGGVMIQTKTGTYATGKKYNLSFRQGDPHKGPGPYIVLGDASIK